MNLRITRIIHIDSERRQPTLNLFVLFIYSVQIARRGEDRR